MINLASSTITMIKIAKTLFLLMTLTSLFFFSSCEKLDTISTDGYYQGSLVYQEQPLFAAISFHGNNYAEVASGGALNQKFPCITKGTYKIRHNTISFSPTIMPVVPDCTCAIMVTDVKFDCILSGDYTLIQSGNNIKFQRGTGNDLQVYNLTLIEPNP
jgi:hypothetical protein